MDIKVGSRWVNKDDETNTVTLESVGAFSVTGSSTKDGQYMASKSDFLHYFKPQEKPTITVGSVWRYKKDGELVYVESLDDSLWPINFNSLDNEREYSDDEEVFLKEYEFVSASRDDLETSHDEIKAGEILKESIKILAERGKKYDKTGNNSERNMQRIVDMFNAATGHNLSEAQGNIFMVCLKVVRAETSTCHDNDHYVDGVNYFAMAGEASSKHYKGNV